MRTLTSVQSATEFLLDLELRILAADVSTTWIFTNKNISEFPSAISWEIPYQGGVSLPSGYNITLEVGPDFIRSNFKNIYRGTTFLKVFVNSDNFTPHIGRVKSVERDPDNLNTLKLVIYDKFLDSNPKVPRAAIVDSYSTVHPEILNNDLGYSLYYGKHTRPFYFTPVDCSISSLIGPRNVSSANHVTSLYYYTDTDLNKLWLKTTWNQQTGSNNLTVAFGLGRNFLVGDIPGTRKMYKLSNSTLPKPALLFGGSLTGPYSEGSIEDIYPIYFKGTTFLYNFYSATYGNDAGYTLQPQITFNFADRMYGIGAMFYHSKATITTSRGFGGDTQGLLVGYCTESGYGLGGSRITWSTTGAVLINSGILFDTNEFSGIKTSQVYIANILNIDSGAGPVTIENSFDFDLMFASSAYKNYSIYGAQVSCVDIAISENPNGIVRDLITNEAGFNIVASQNSACQADVSNFNFQCFFSKRKPLSDILNEFGRITGTYYWIGDSGYINSRTYQQSATVSNSINWTITASDIQFGTLKIKENPLGATMYQNDKYSRIKMNYNYNYDKDIYESFIVADKGNTPACNSVYNAGINNELSIQTEYIKETATASLWALNEVRRGCIDYSILEFRLPAQFMGMEVTDIAQISHPSLLVSPSLFQAKNVISNYKEGYVDVTFNEIANL